MISVCEKSGALALMLDKISEFNEQEFNNKVDTLSKTIEPIVMGGLGAVVALLVIALYLPIFQMTNAIH
jgi:type IV pilus assembly protein PilC